MVEIKAITALATILSTNIAEISMSVNVVLIKIHAWNCIIIIECVIAMWCDAMDVKIFKAYFKLVSTECAVPLPFLFV